LLSIDALRVQCPCLLLVHLLLRLLLYLLLQTLHLLVLRLLLCQQPLYHLHVIECQITHSDDCTVRRCTFIR
jgi:hypothetical protein